MNQAYLKEFMDKTAFPAEAFLLGAAERLTAAGLEGELNAAVRAYAEGGFSTGAIDPLLEKIAGAAGLSPYTLWLFVLVESSLPVREDFRKRGISEEIFWETFSDVRYKALECKEVQGVWGNFVAFWYDIFFTGRIVKLGRLEFETCEYFGRQPYEKHGVKLQRGDVVRSIHIPSSGEPFDEAARLDSYRRAYAFFRPELNGGPLVCVCHSWLLYPPYREILSPASNIVSFMGDFELLYQEDEEDFGDAWRLFGADYRKPAAELPEDTSMRRAFKRYLLNGGKPGAGMGVLVFDGEKLLRG